MTHQIRQQESDCVKIEQPSLLLASLTDDFTIGIISGDDYPGLDELQASMEDPLANLVAAAIRQGLEQGTFVIIDNQIVERIDDEL